LSGVIWARLPHRPLEQPKGVCVLLRSPLGPTPGGGRPCFGLARDEAAVTRTHCDIAWPAQATFTSNSMREDDGLRSFGKGLAQQPLNAFGGRRRRQSVKLLPETNWFALGAKRHFAQGWVAFLEDERLPVRLQELGITLEHRRRRARRVDGGADRPFRE